MVRRVAAVFGVVLMWFVLMYLAGFYAATANLPDGYSCRPTITFGYRCTAPDGHTFGGH